VSNEPIVMRSKSNDFTTKVLPEFIQIYLEAGWVIEGREAHKGGEGMMIPDEVIEVAAEALVASTLGDRSGINWEEFFEAARGALKAAAPYLMAQAFDEGQKSGMRHADRLIAAAKIGKPELPGPISPNPYARKGDGK